MSGAFCEEVSGFGVAGICVVWMRSYGLCNRNSCHELNLLMTSVRIPLDSVTASISIVLCQAIGSTLFKLIGTDTPVRY